MDREIVNIKSAIETIESVISINDESVQNFKLKIHLN